MPSSGIQGDPFSDINEAVTYLESEGIVFEPWYTMHLPGWVLRSDINNSLEARAAYYLVHEWDFAFEVIDE